MQESLSISFQQKSFKYSTQWKKSIMPCFASRFQGNENIYFSTQKYPHLLLPRSGFRSSIFFSPGGQVMRIPGIRVTCPPSYRPAAREFFKNWFKQAARTGPLSKIHMTYGTTDQLFFCCSLPNSSGHLLSGCDLEYTPDLQGRSSWRKKEQKLRHFIN
jgi:hypothetical protein